MLHIYRAAAVSDTHHAGMSCNCSMDSWFVRLGAMPLWAHVDLPRAPRSLRATRELHVLNGEGPNAPRTKRWN